MVKLREGEIISINIILYFYSFVRYAVWCNAVEIDNFVLPSGSWAE